MLYHGLQTYFRRNCGWDRAVETSRTSGWLYSGTCQGKPWPFRYLHHHYWWWSNRMGWRDWTLLHTECHQSFFTIDEPFAYGRITLEKGREGTLRCGIQFVDTAWTWPWHTSQSFYQCRCDSACRCAY